MNNNYKNQCHNSLLTLVVGFIVAIGRINLNDNHTNDLIIIMSVVNIVAFDFVIVLMLNDIYNDVKSIIINSGSSTREKNTKKVILEILFLLSFGICATLGVYYVLKYRSAKYNDAISIIALTCSIANEGFVKLMGKPVYKTVSIINKFILLIKRFIHYVKLQGIECYKKKILKNKEQDN